MLKGKPNKRYTPEFKIKVIETMQKDNLSYKETAREFDVSSDTVVAKWERIYLEEGKDGFYVERRGRKSTERPQKTEERGGGRYCQDSSQHLLLLQQAVCESKAG